jgi:hypothetical protein
MRSIGNKKNLFPFGLAGKYWPEKYEKLEFVHAIHSILHFLANIGANMD